MTTANQREIFLQELAVSGYGPAELKCGSYDNDTGYFYITNEDTGERDDVEWGDVVEAAWSLTGIRTLAGLALLLGLDQDEETGEVIEYLCSNVVVHGLLAIQDGVPSPKKDEPTLLDESSGLSWDNLEKKTNLNVGPWNWDSANLALFGEYKNRVKLIAIDKNLDNSRMTVGPYSDDATPKIDNLLKPLLKLIQAFNKDMERSGTNLRAMVRESQLRQYESGQLGISEGGRGVLARNAFRTLSADKDDIAYERGLILRSLTPSQFALDDIGQRILQGEAIRHKVLNVTHLTKANIKSLGRFNMFLDFKQALLKSWTTNCAVTGMADGWQFTITLNAHNDQDRDIAWRFGASKTVVLSSTKIVQLIDRVVLEGDIVEVEEQRCRVEFISLGQAGHDPTKLYPAIRDGKLGVGFRPNLVMVPPFSCAKKFREGLYWDQNRILFSATDATSKRFAESWWNGVRLELAASVSAAKRAIEGAKDNQKAAKVQHFERKTLEYQAHLKVAEAPDGAAANFADLDALGSETKEAEGVPQQAERAVPNPNEPQKSFVHLFKR